MVEPMEWEELLECVAEPVRCGGHITFPHGKPASETKKGTVIKNDMVYLGPQAIPFKKQVSGTHFVSLKIQRWLVIMLGISGHRGMRYGDDFMMITAWLNPGLSREKPESKPSLLEM